MNHLSLFTGAGGGEYAARLLGWRTVVYVESNEHCRSVIAQRQRDGIFDEGPIFDDVRTFDGTGWRGRVDIISGGFPCQPFSVAGKGLAADDERNMWPEFARIICEVEPAFVWLENSPGLLDSRGCHYAGVILGELADLGFDAAWTVLGAAEVGAPHKRNRWWCLAAHPDRVWELQQSRAREKRRRFGDGAASSPGGEELAPSELGNWWTTKPRVVCMVHGLAGRSERLRALGNGQVPAVAAMAWEILSGEQ